MNSYSNMLITDNHNQQILCDSFDLHFPSISQPSSSQLSNITNLDRNNGRRKRKRKDEKETEKPKEVVHVRAKRGQATDSHSLAERVRREKINEKLRFLQHLVPGCYKAMGMAVMLDVIINYVQSLQNQIEFLSLKLSAASMHYDFNLDRDNPGTMHQGTNAYVLQELETMERNQEIGGPPNYFHSGDWAL